MTRDISLQVIEIAGSTMRYIDIGAGETVVLGHSYLWDHRMWQPQIEELAQTRRVIVPDLWGHGGSGALPEGTRDVKDLAMHHLELLDRLGVERFALVGLSVGGMWAAELALIAPNRVTALALMNTFLGPEPEGTRERNLAMLAAVKLARAVPEPIAQAMLPMFFAPATFKARPDLISQFRDSLRETDPQRIVDTLVPLGRLIFGRRDTLPDLAGLDVPAIVIAGRYDQARSVAEGQQTAAVLGCSFVELAEAGHVSALETPTEVNRHLTAFLDRHLQSKEQ
ncbi:alpha/beta fold hydrolase [Rhizobium sp. CG5]|uniref:alpha/beta fold hydrolase n=1 Tax=Rhizobium sp. CG5 TaxID=2726076 RepID=UPI002033A4B3|nr:alpha/beta fold hydrolase [Rhizobium sp. CG5]MCM2477327.1 alpha/beta fold hydrolase [Rhizobium sp. CG5]